VWLKLSRLINDYIDSINLSELTGIANQLEDASTADCQSIVDFVESGFEAFGPNREDCSLMER
jgi:hypothetical protein